MGEILAAMMQVCPEAYLLVDETYREAAYGDDKVATSAVALGPRVVSVASLSKCHGAPGLRLGWAITREGALREQLVLGKFNTAISCSPIDEALAIRVLEAGDRILAERRRRLHQGLTQTAAWVAENGALIEWIRPDAGALCCVRLKPHAFDDAAVTRFYGALAAHDVRVANGIWFGDEERVFRLGFGLLEAADLQAGLGVLTDVLDQALQRP
jgi:DNA-binding transcriptional MocR family regulator